MLANAHPSVRFEVLENATRNITVPLHPGAEAYYDELIAKK